MVISGDRYGFVLSGAFGPANRRRTGRDEMDNQLNFFATASLSAAGGGFLRRSFIHLRTRRSNLPGGY